MTEIKRVLIATDLSVHTDSALYMGKKLEEFTSCDITLLHIADVPYLWEWPSILDKFQAELQSSAETRIKEQMKRCGVDFKTQILFGETYTDLNQYLKDNEFDLLIMGHRTDRPLFSSRSLAKKIIASTEVPVFICTNDKPISKVGCLVDLSKISEKCISEAEWAGKLFDAEIHYFTTIPDIASKALLSMPFAVSNYAFSNEEKESIVNKARTEIKTKIGNIGDEYIHVNITPDEIIKVLAQQAEEANIDLAILAKHNRGPVEKLFIGSVTKGFIDHFNGNILVLPGK